MEIVSRKEPFFRPLVFSLIPREVDDIPTAATDGKHLLYNREFMEKLPTEQQCGVVLHEVFHCMRKHLWRREGRYMMKWNVACDLAINPAVSDSFPLPKGALIDYKYYDMSAEDIYDKLPKTRVKKMKVVRINYGKEQQPWGDHSKWEGQGKKEEKSAGKQLVDKLMGKNPKKPSPEISKQEGKQLEKKWQDLYEKHIVKNYGKLSSNLKRMIEKEYYVPAVDWATLVASILSEDVSDYTFSQPDRRYLEADYVMPDMFSYDRLKDVVFAYDTSGSISQSDLHAYYQETMKLFDNFSTLQGWLAVCDARLHSFDEVSPQQSYDEFDFRGGGGTAFEPVFEEIQKRGIKPKALFYFTDTEGSFPDTPPEYPVFWLVRTEIGRKPYVNVPFGQVIPFMS